jgi:hypothetical protein
MPITVLKVKKLWSEQKEIPVLLVKTKMCLKCNYFSNLIL